METSKSEPGSRSLTRDGSPDRSPARTRVDLDRLTTPQLIARLAQDAQNLVKAEIELGKSELRTAISGFGQTLRRLALGIVLGLIAANLLAAGAVLGLAQVLPAWAAALLVGAALALASIVSLSRARSPERREP